VGGIIAGFAIYLLGTALHPQSEHSVGIISLCVGIGTALGIAMMFSGEESFKK